MLSDCASIHMDHVYDLFLYILMHGSLVAWTFNGQTEKLRFH